ncbi:hypothetical protein NOVO_09280 (plasmid) [Rickettsiales bacterium Ac37b]|nr:hypothetical protein NOVO_09280 [Rickettsiales bacterium Ac37b]
MKVYSNITNEQGIWFYPSLANKIGDNESLVLMLIHEYFSSENRLEDLEELCVSYLPSLTSISIKKAIGKLIKIGLLVRYRDSAKEIEQENKKCLVINYDLLKEIILPNKLNYGRW